MNAVTDAESSYWTTNLKKKTKKGPGVTMMPYSFIGLEREWPIYCRWDDIPKGFAWEGG